jgi:hypothetical protein
MVYKIKHLQRINVSHINEMNIVSLFEVEIL